MTYEPPRDKTNKMACAPSEDSDQLGHSPSLIRVFTVRMKQAWVLSYPLSAQRRLWSDWADAQADLSLCWAHSHFGSFVMRRLISAPLGVQVPFEKIRLTQLIILTTHQTLYNPSIIKKKLLHYQLCQPLCLSLTIPSSDRKWPSIHSPSNQIWQLPCRLKVRMDLL